MFHARTSRKKIEAVIAILGALDGMHPAEDGEGFVVSRPGGDGDRYATIAEKLRAGLASKRYDLTMEEARRLVRALDLYNLSRTDNIGHGWDEEAESLFHELRKLFAKVYGQAVYSDPPEPA